MTKITEIYKELETFNEFGRNPFLEKDIEKWDMNDWNNLSTLTQELVRRKNE